MGIALAVVTVLYVVSAIVCYVLITIGIVLLIGRITGKFSVRIEIRKLTRASFKRSSNLTEDNPKWKTFYDSQREKSTGSK